MTLIHLPERAILAVRGGDTSAFLQGLITNDIRKLEKSASLYAALLSPQGKFLHDFLICKHEDELWLDTEKSRLDDLIKKLTAYKLRAKIEIAALPHLHVYASMTEPEEAGLKLRDPRHEKLGWRLVSPSPLETSLLWEAYEHHRLQLAIPDGSRDFIPERSFVMEFGMEGIHGVDFNKGCYVGQEVTARSKFRGSVKKCLHHISAEASLPPPGTPIRTDGADIGEMRSSLGKVGLAIVRIKEAQNASGKLYAGDVEITAAVPNWFPELPSDEN